MVVLVAIQDYSYRFGCFVFLISSVAGVLYMKWMDGLVGAQNNYL